MPAGVVSSATLIRGYLIGGWLPRGCIDCMGAVAGVAIWSLVAFLEGIICECLSGSMLTEPDCLWLSILESDHVVLPGYVNAWPHRDSYEVQLTNLRYDFQTPYPGPCFPHYICIIEPMNQQGIITEATHALK